jgi:hypothetical protein
VTIDRLPLFLGRPSKEQRENNSAHSLPVHLSHSLYTFGGAAMIFETHDLGQSFAYPADDAD